jgi:hypothetical protein|nr:MAG TPA: YspA [Caudoviricetes sp.]
MTYFISGHRDITEEEFKKYYIPAIYSAYYEDLDFAGFVVGDYEGVDKMAMDYITKNLPCELIIFHMFENPRNTPEDESRVIYVGNYTTDEERDAAMTMASDIDIAFVREGRWDSGTAQNIKRRHTLK